MTELELEPTPASDAGRARPRTLATLGLVIALGLATRSGHAAVPEWVARHAGDALWTMAVYVALALVRPRAAPRALAALALLLSCAVEASQLARWPWLVELRRTLPGRLVLGQGWQALDLARYAAGTLLAYGVDVGLERARRRRP